MTAARRRPLVLLCTLALFAGLVPAACSTAATGGSLTVLGSWTGAEEQAFRSVLDEFTRQTDIEVNYQGTRALSQVLAADVQRGSPPDVAFLPSPGELARYVRERHVKPLDPALEASFGPQWQRLQRLGRDRLYAVAVKADLKSMIWYDPSRLPGPPPATWTDLVALAERITAGGGTPWCLGMGAPPESGWPGTDWVEDILLHRSGPAAYRRWAAGELPWTSPEVREAWRLWGSLVTGEGATPGGPAAALLTNFGDAAAGMFTDPQRCALEHQASFMIGSYQRLPGAPVPGRTVDFFPFPSFAGAPADATVAQVSADLAGMFVDTPQARTLLRYLVSADAQRRWLAFEGASVFSVNPEVAPDSYRDPVRSRVAATLAADGTLCFDAADLMPTTMANAFYRAALEYLSDPAGLDEVLAKLDRIREGIPATDWLDVSCATR